MRIYLSLQSALFAKNLAPAVRELSARGHDVVIGLCQGSDRDARQIGRALSGMPRSVTVVMAPARMDGWRASAAALRSFIDYLHFLRPEFRSVPYSRVRRRGDLPDFARSMIRRHRLGYGWRHRLALWALSRAEEALPADSGIVAHLREHRPDVLVVSPLLGPEVEQLEHVRAAKALGVPTVHAVHSWDNLSSKGLIRLRPERIAVWNEIQKREAMGLHGQPARNIAVTGAYAFDDWFATTPSLSRDELCRKVGLPVDRKIILYLGSALYLPKNQPETVFVREWLGRLRSGGDGRLASAAILIRPHPKRAKDFRNLPHGDPAVTVWPQHGEMPMGHDRHQSFFDCLYHADAVVGLNTSAMIEAAIVGHPVRTLLDERHALSQEQTYHFGYLSDPDTGCLQVARSWDEHIGQLDKALAGQAGRDRAERFVDSFVRSPDGSGAAAAVMAGAIEHAARRRVLVLPGRMLRPLIMPWLRRFRQRVEAPDEAEGWQAAQTVVIWQERQGFLASLKLTGR